MARILIVDDSPTETYRFREILTKHGYDVLEASNGADGVTVAKAEQPDFRQHARLPVMKTLSIFQLLL